MSYDYILFDLDGTLTDSALGITNSALYALDKFGMTIEDKDELRKFIGPPLWESFEKNYGFTKEEAERAVGYFREYYKDKGMFENYVYEGIEELLKSLKEKGKTLIVATSKAELFARQILEHYDIAKYFDFIAGANMDGTRSIKAEVISHALDSCKITELKKVIMIGDREHDIIGAKTANVAAIGVLYGYGSQEEFEEFGADYIVNSVAEIEEIVV